MAIILHIAERDVWNQSKTNRSYRPETFAVEGFIHCSTPEQVLGVANTRFRGRTDLLLLSIDTDKVSAEVRYENLEGGEQLFPHIYGVLAHDAVIRVVEFKLGADGRFGIADWRLPSAD